MQFVTFSPFEFEMSKALNFFQIEFAILWHIFQVSLGVESEIMETSERLLSGHKSSLFLGIFVSVQMQSSLPQALNCITMQHPRAEHETIAKAEGKKQQVSMSYGKMQ